MERTRRGEAAKPALAAAEAIIPLLYECHCTNTTNAASGARARRPLERLLRHRVQHTEPFDRARRGEAAEAALAAAEAVPAST